MKRRPLRAVALVGVLLLLIATVVIVVLKRDTITRRLQRATLPDPVPYQTAVSHHQLPSAIPSTSPTRPPATHLRPSPTTALPAEINLAVPFTAQAPYGRWEPPYKEFCEEASVLMAVSYLRGETLPTAAVADEKMLAIKAFEDERFGYYEDTTAAETAVILREYYDIDSVELVEDPSVADLKRALAAGKLVIVPAAGRFLGNPFYTPPGPLYHMLVIKGYTADEKFITNDPGTRRGADFLYSSQTIMNAMHDWRGDGQVELGRKVVIIVG